MQAQLDAEQQRLFGLETQLASERGRLERLTRLFQDQTLQLRAFEAEHVTSVERLEQRLREIYMEGTPDVLEFVLAATREIAAPAADQRAVRDRLVTSRDELVAADAAKEQTLALVRADQAEHAGEIDALQAESAALAAQIQAAQAAAAPAPSTSSSSASPAPAPLASSGSRASPSGFIFPVSGPVVSGFGRRGGRIHEGIDIIAASGTPVIASASGTVIRSDYGRGYGNVVVIDHGNGLSTTYAHNSSLAVGVGTAVLQGTVIAYVGSTGNSSGPHVHLEFRITGQPSTRAATCRQRRFFIVSVTLQLMSTHLRLLR